jgi:hypothetical protein
MDRYTFPTGTVGGGIAVRDLAEKTKWMRRIRGDKVCAVVALSNMHMNTRFGGRQRPHFVVKRWVRFGGDAKPALPGPTPSPTPIGATTEPAKTEPLPGMQPVSEPTLSEQMGDDSIFFNDSPDPNVPKAASPPVQPKPAPTARPQVNKSGVQKIAGGRGR